MNTDYEAAQGEMPDTTVTLQKSSTSFDQVNTQFAYEAGG